MTQKDFWKSVGKDSFMTSIGRMGLCFAVTRVSWASYDVISRELRRMNHHQPPSTKKQEAIDAYWWPRTEAGNRCRRRFALKMRTAPMRPVRRTR